MPNGGNGGSGFDFGGIFGGLLGELGAFIAAILQFLADLVNALVQILNFLFAGEVGIFGFSFASLTDVWKGMVKIRDQIFKVVVLGALKRLWDLYGKIAAWAKKLKDWLDKLHTLMKKYQMMYFRRVIQLIQRTRKILVIFRFFHLKWAQKLDRWLAGVEGKITHYLVLVASKTNEIIAWVDFIVDPLGALKYVPLLKGFFAALNVTWAAIFGTNYQGPGGRGQKAGPSTPVQLSWAETTAEIQSKTGAAAKISSEWPSRFADFADGMGL
jgi:hypothetical protein